MTRIFVFLEVNFSYEILFHPEWMRCPPSLDGLFFIGIRLVDPFEQLNGLFAAKAGSILSKLIFLPFLYVGQVMNQLSWLYS